MNNNKKCVSVLIVLLISISTFSQTIEDGRKFMYYEKYISAKTAFQSLVSANPNNIDAVYWLGQSMILPDDNKDLAGAKELYRKTLESNSNAPLLIAGMGHIELLEGKTQDARNRFETALSLSQSKSVPVINAIGAANANYDSKEGDAAFAIDKLKLATAIKGFKDPETWCIMGDAYRKFTDGGNALKAYESALAINPGYARAKYRIGKIYQTQGAYQEELYMKYFNDAIATDASYTPVYLNLYKAFYTTNVGKSAEYLEKYLSFMGADEPNACYYRASMKYAQGLFQDAISQANLCITQGGASPYPNLYGVKGYAAFKLGDSVTAKSAFDAYFQKQKADKLGSGDYETYAKLLLKFPGNETLAGTYIDKAVELDSTEAGKVSLVKSVASTYEVQKKFKDAADWYKKVLSIKKNPSKTDLYNAGYNYYRSGNFQPSIEMFNIYTQKFADDIFGYYMVGKANWGIDTTMVLGLANASFEKAILVGEAATDKSKIKNQLLGSYKYLVAWAANVKKDKELALSYSDKALLVDPTDQEIISNRDAISKMNMNAPPPQPPKPLPVKPATPVKPVKTNGAVTNPGKVPKAATTPVKKK
jgi:tetratricopeptide (TPR) repeat protein